MQKYKRSLWQAVSGKVYNFEKLPNLKITLQWNGANLVEKVILGKDMFSPLSNKSTKVRRIALVAIVHVGWDVLPEPPGGKPA